MRIYIWGVPYGTPLFVKNMPKIIIFVLTFLIFSILFTHPASAYQTVVSESASIKKPAYDLEFDYRVVELKRFLEKYNSPLSVYAPDFVRYADKYQIDYRLVPAITGVESTFGKRIPQNSYNAYGWANGAYKFSSWRDSISHVTMKLRYEYINKGAGTSPKIAKRYAPPSITWGTKVNYFVKKISMLPISYDI